MPGNATMVQTMIKRHLPTLRRPGLRAHRGVLGICPLFLSAAWALPPAAAANHDRLTFTNGDVLTGKLDREVAGTVFFQSDELGEISVPWSKIRTLETAGAYVVLEDKPGVHARHAAAEARLGRLAVAGSAIELSAGGRRQAIPVANAQYILDRQTFNRQLRENPDPFQGWNGSATAGVTLVEGTENQRTYTSAIALTRSVPTVSWLTTRNRMQADFSSSYGKITQPAYVGAAGLVPATFTKSSILHADAERDQYLTNRFYAVVQTAWDHNYSQGLDLQQVYGAGFGVSALKRATQQFELKGTLQYERQSFIASASGTNQELVGSTFSASYLLKLPRSIVFNQTLAYVPAYNTPRDYSASETDTVTFPFYKSVAFTLGTIDSYLNDPPSAEPPNSRNSFQFTTGITYTVKSRY